MLIERTLTQAGVIAAVGTRAVQPNAPVAGEARPTLDWSVFPAPQVITADADSPSSNTLASVGEASLSDHEKLWPQPCAGRQVSCRAAP